MRDFSRFSNIGFILIFIYFLTGCIHLPFVADSKKPPDGSASFSNETAKGVTPGQDDMEIEYFESEELSSTLSTCELIEEAHGLACMGARQYLQNQKPKALTNMQAAMMNLQLADLPENMQNISFFQPYLPEDLRSVDLETVYLELKRATKSTETDLPEPSSGDDIKFTGTDRGFIEIEIIRLTKNLGEEYPTSDDLDIFVREVERFLKYYQTERRDWFERSYYRMLKYQDTIDRILTEKRLPSELAYLAFIESGYLYRATSRAQARGIWQFIRSTGRYYDLKIGRYVDERLDPVKSTIAAREYLLDLVSIFGSRSFLLAMASYNAGEGKVQRCLKQLDNPFEDRSFWKIRPCLRRETREYIPRIIAAAIICENPSRFGFDLPDKNKYTEQLDLVICPLRVKLYSISKSAGITISDLRNLNPDLPSGGSWTPSNNTHLWVPKGTASKVKIALLKMPSPPATPAVGQYHRVRKGENLYKIGRRYKIPFKKLALWNNIPPPYKIKPSQKICLHPPGSSSSSSGSGVRKTVCNEILVYIVQKG